jgi:hypothetical protein
MLRITVNGKDVDTSDDIAIEMNVTNPLFSESGFDELYSYGFSIPNTPRNKSIIKQDKSISVRILFGNHLITEGVGYVKTKFNSYSIDFKNQSIDLKQVLEKIQLKSLPLETVVVCDPGDAPSVKGTKWKDHMTQTTITDLPSVGSHKFPFIRAWDDTAEIGMFAEMTEKNPPYTFYVNAFWNGEYVKNPGYPMAYNDSRPAWITTASPCIRIQYLFDVLIAYLNIKVEEDQLKDVPEFQQMVHYSLLALDKIEDNGLLNFNIFANEFDLAKFIPEKNGTDLFALANELFGVYYSYRNGKLQIRLKKNILSSKPVDFSKYCNPEYNIDQKEKKTISLDYEIDHDAIDLMNNTIWDYAVNVLPLPPEILTKHDIRYIGNNEKTDEILVSYIPMLSRVFIVDRIYGPLYSDIVVEEEATCMDLYIPFAQTSSYYDDQDFRASDAGSQTWLLGLIRGNYDLYNTTHATWNSRPVWSNSKKIDSSYNDQGIDYSLGTCSIYLNDASSHVDVYLKRYLEHLRLADEITKIVYLPLHKILEIMSWKEPNHIIKQRNLSFKGTVKEVNFTLYKSSISPVEITYSVVDQAALGDYNDDYNIDFSI